LADAALLEKHQEKTDRCCRRSDRSRLAVAPILILEIPDEVLAAEQFGCVDLLDDTLQDLAAERARLKVNRALVKRGVVEH